MCGKHVRLNVWKRYAHIVELLNRCPSLVKINDNALAVGQNVRTVNTDELVTISKPCVIGLSTVSGTKDLRLVLQLKRLTNWDRPANSVIYQLLKVLTYTVLTVAKVTYQEMLRKCTKVVTQPCIGEKGNGKRLFAV